MTLFPLLLATCVGTLQPRTAPDPLDDQWMIGCEVLDRDFAKFSAYKDYLPRLGIRSIRLQGGWAKCEKEKGKCDFAWLDEAVDFARANGLNPVLETGYGNPLYKGGGGRDLAAGFPHGEEGLAAWDRWVDALSKHFAGRVRDWAMWNEPDIGNPADTTAVGGHHTPEAIAAFNVRTAKVIRRNIPDARIAGLSLATNDPGFHEACYKALGQDIGLFWRFIYHGYVPAPEESYGNVMALKALCAKYAPQATLWQGENGAPSEMPGDGLALNHIAWSEVTQAKYDLRRMVGDFVHGVPSSVFTICDYVHPGRGIGSYGLLRADANRDVIAVKQAFAAVRNVATVFDSNLVRVPRQVSSPERTLWLYEYVRKGQPLFVFWTCGGYEETAQGWKMVYRRPSDDNATRPVVIEHPGAPLRDPVWLDLRTGEVHDLPRASVLARQGGTTYVNVPAYDSPCVLTARAALEIAPPPEPLKPGTAFKDNAVYKADASVIDVYAKDTVAIDDPRYYIKGFTNVLQTAFFLKGKKNVTLDFNGAKLLLHGKLQPFVLDGCENVTIKNVTVALDRSAYSQGEVVSIAGNDLVVKFDRETFPYRIDPDGALVFTSPTWEGYRIERAPVFAQFFDPATRRGRCLSLAFFAPNPYIDPALPWAPGAFRFTAKPEGDCVRLTSANDLWLRNQVRPGDAMVVAHENRSICNCLMHGCAGVTLENYRILNGRGMGIFPFHCKDVLIDGLKMTYDHESPSFIANSADGIHAFACSGDFTIRNSVIEGTIDDALNVHGNFYKLVSAEGDKIVADTGLEPFATTALYLPGDRIRVYNGFTLDGAGEYVVKAVRPLAAKTVEFTLDRPVGAHKADDAIENLSAQCKLTIRNCRFGRSNTHLRLQTRGGILIEDCESEMPFWMTGDMSFWFESSPCDKVTIRNVRFKTGHGVVRASPEFFPTEKAPYYHGDVTIENCSFESGDPVDLKCTRRVTIRNCTSPEAKPRAHLKNCGEADAPGWDIRRTEEKPTKLGYN